MLVNVKKIEALSPCKGRFDNFLEKHPTFSGTMTRFLKLEGITHQDKLWVYFRLLPKELIGKVAADFAESVLHVYEAKFPGDSRPRLAIEAARAAATDDAACAAYAAARAAATDDAACAAYAAARAAEAARAAHGAACAAYAAARAADAAPNQEAVQLKIMKKWLRGL